MAIFPRKLMRALRTLLWTACATLAVAGAARAETFQDEAIHTITSSPALAAERARLQAVRQSTALAWAELLPQVTGDAAVIAEDRTQDRVLDFTARGQPEYWVASVRASTMLFGSGRVWASTRQARAQVASAVALYQDAIQNLALEFTEAYAGVRYARAVLSAQEESLANLMEQERYARANQREGFLTRTDVAQAESRVALARADTARARAQLVAAEEAYARVSGRHPGDLEIPPVVEGLPVSLDLALEQAEDEHPALVAAVANVSAANAAVNLAAANGRMRIFLESTNTTFDASPSGDFTQEFESNVSVRATVPIFSGGAVRARERQQRHLRNASRYELADVHRRLRERVSVSWSNLIASRARLEASAVRLEAAELASRGARREQQFGQRSMIDVLNQEQERLSARVARAEAERDLAVAERAMAASAGMLSQLLGVDVDALAARRERRPAPPLDDDEW